MNFHYAEQEQSFIEEVRQFLKDEPPETFPDSSDVLVLGCQMDRYILAEMVVILGDSPSVLTRTPDSLLRCPDPENNGL